MSLVIGQFCANFRTFQSQFMLNVLSSSKVKLPIQNSLFIVLTREGGKMLFIKQLHKPTPKTFWRS